MLSLQLDYLRRRISFVRQLTYCCLETRQQNRHAARLDFTDFHKNAVRPSTPFSNGNPYILANSWSCSSCSFSIGSGILSPRRNGTPLINAVDRVFSSPMLNPPINSSC